MFITNVAPLTRIPRSFPQTLSYFTSQKLERGSLVLVPLQKKNIEAVVLSQKNVKDVKQEIKKADFKLKPILKIIEKQPVLDECQLQLAKWISNYYFASFGKTLKLFLAANKKFQKSQNQQIKLRQKNKQQPILYFTSPDFLPKKEIEDAISQKKEVLFLVPERNKIEFWRKKIKREGVMSENVKIAPRSGLFLRFFNLGLIVVSETNSEYYKEKREPRFFAPDVAKVLAKIWGTKLVFLSSFPSVENYFEAKEGRLIWKKIKNKKEIKKIEINPLTSSGDNSTRNDLTLLNARAKKAWSPFAPETLNEIKEYLKQKKKILLFLNRKGAATTLLCQDCGWQKFCPHCGVPMTYHKQLLTNNKQQITSDNQISKMICHYCGFESKVPEYCENCQSWRLTTLGVGVEKIEEEIKKNFPQANVFRLDRETATKTKDQKTILKNFFETGDILISTSLIFSYFFEGKFDLTVFVSFNSQLALPDFRFEEKLRRQIENLSFLTKEEFILQNYSLKKDVLSAFSEEFYKEALKKREEYFYPPFSKLIKLTFKDKNQKKAREEAYILKEKLIKQLTVYSPKEKLLDFLDAKPQTITQVLGPVPAFIPKIRGKYRWNILIKIKKPGSNINEMNRAESIKKCLLQVVPADVETDIDPVHFF